MLRRLLDWNRRRKERARSHDVAWAGLDNPGPSGFSLFQGRCEAALLALLEQRGVALEGRVTQEGEEPYVHGRLGTTPWVVWIYLDQAQLSGPGPAAVNLEQWDARTPDDLIEKFLGRVRQALDEAGV